MSIVRRMEAVRERITRAEQLYGRPAGSVELMAVSKTRPASDIHQALDAGQTAFGENYLQDALEKIDQLAETPAKWHYIGRIQSNKTRPIAENFDWVHSVDKLKLLRRLGDQRPEHLSPLNVCLQINLDQEESKGGLTGEGAAELVAKAGMFPNLRIRGLMAIPAPTPDIESQRRPFRLLRLLRDRLATTAVPLETLSMGMSADLEAAIAEGATMIRVGTAIFGPRQPAAGKQPDPT
ncbi:MAG: YggS family pyridoxal phosphate-dependent enzyme [Gammaproteobacteria bacterium]|nr:YggS family pyridoxal phosphate-dependent enzyme [Gammaproteobacteria bacterium]